LKIHNDIAEALDEGSMTTLIMLDLSVDYDVIDHSILLKHFEFWNWNDSSSLTKAYIEEITILMNNNMLNFNKDNTEFVVFSRKQHVNKTKNLRVKVDSSYITFPMSVRKLALYWGII